MTLPRKAIEAGARAIGDASETAGQVGDLRTNRISPHFCEELATACLTAALAAEGMALVPKEPTDEMVIAGVLAGAEQNKPFTEKIRNDAKSFAASVVTAGDGRLYKAAYRAMLKAYGGEDE